MKYSFGGSYTIPAKQSLSVLCKFLQWPALLEKTFLFLLLKFFFFILQGKFVAAFASSNLGDVSPNTDGAKCTDTGKPCDYNTSTCNGKVTLNTSCR